jgi:voltage-gated sodium channel
VVKLSLKVVLNSFFEPFIILIILINTLSMAMDKYPENSQSLNYFLNLVNTICTLIFAFEAILKLVGFGLRSYWSDSFNKFDFSIVIVSLIEMEVAGNGGGSVFSALRAFRLFKIFKLFKVGDLRILLDSISFTVAAIGDYVILLCLFIYVFALLGMSFFAGAVKFDKYG